MCYIYVGMANSMPLTLLMLIILHRWPKRMMAYAQDQSYANREISDLSETEKIIADFFADKEKVAKLIKFLSLEENKDSDQFDFVRAKMFKRLFRNHGDVVLRHLRPHLEKGTSILNVKNVYQGQWP